MKPITLNQLRTLSALQILTKIKGYPPTFDELAEHIDVSFSMVRDSTLRLERAGVITWNRRIRRSLHILDKGWTLIPLKRCPGGLAPRKKKMEL
jgi:Mn-dependent DtxR family transcriptional regulator